MGGQGSEVREGIAPTFKDLPPMVPERKNKEGLSSSKLITKKASQPASSGSACVTTTVEGNILEAGMGQAASEASAKQSTPDQTKSETAPVELTQGQSSDTATQEAALDQTISEGATGGAELIQNPPASCIENRIPPALPVQRATVQTSPSKLMGNLRVLDLDSMTRVRPTTPR